jgi:hypothetical protein
MKFRIVFWDHPWWWRQHEPLKRRSTIILHGQSLMMEAARTSETSVDNYFTRPIPDDGGSTNLWNVGRQLFYTAHPWWWRQHVPLKRRSTIILHGSTFQKTILNFILAAVRTWNLTLKSYSLAELYVKCVYLNLFEWKGALRLWNILKGGACYKSSITSCVGGLRTSCHSKSAFLNLFTLEEPLK